MISSTDPQRSPKYAATLEKFSLSSLGLWDYRLRTVSEGSHVALFR